jgi:phenolic acid decarboxylase
MKKLFCFLLCFFFVLIPVTSYNSNENPEVSQNYEIDHIIRNLISRDILFLLKNFVDDNDFTVDFNRDHYVPLMEEMKDIIKTYNDTVILNKKYKIISARIEIKGNDKFSKKPCAVIIILYFQEENWNLIINITGNEGNTI